MVLPGAERMVEDVAAVTLVTSRLPVCGVRGQSESPDVALVRAPGPSVLRHILLDGTQAQPPTFIRERSREGRVSSVGSRRGPRSATPLVGVHLSEVRQ